MKHIMGRLSILKNTAPATVPFAAFHFNKGKWDDAKLENILKSTVIQFFYKEAQRSGKPRVLHRGRHHLIQDKAFVTGSAPD